jgi:putative ABC transport system permease protein
MNIDQILVVKAPIVADSTFEGKSAAIKKQFLEVSQVSGVAISNNVPGMDPGGATWYSKVGDNPDNVQFCYQAWVDEDYIPNYEIELLSGRNFTAGQVDTTSVIINEACMPLFSFKNSEEAIGQKLDMGGRVFTIIGVTRNFHQQSSKIAYTPIVINYFPGIRGFYSVRINGGNDPTTTYTKVIGSLNTAWQKIFPDNPFYYFFLDDEFNKQYRSDQQFAKLFTFFSIIATIVACMGLFGLSSFMANKRAREIGIRKVLGSNLNQLFLLLSKEFLIIIAVANIITWPAIYYLMNKWLSGFPYRINLQPGIFLLSALIVFVISIVTISFQIAKAAVANPVKALKTE